MAMTMADEARAAVALRLDARYALPALGPERPGSGRRPGVRAHERRAPRGLLDRGRHPEGLPAAERGHVGLEARVRHRGGLHPVDLDAFAGGEAGDRSEHREAV